MMIEPTGRGDGYFPPSHGASIRPQDRRRHRHRDRPTRPCQNAPISGRGRRVVDRLKSEPCGLGGEAACHDPDYAGTVSQKPTPIQSCCASMPGNTAARLRCVKRTCGLRKHSTWTTTRAPWDRTSRRHGQKTGPWPGDVIGIIGDNRPDWVVGRSRNPRDWRHDVTRPRTRSVARGSATMLLTTAKPGWCSPGGRESGRQDC